MNYKFDKTIRYTNFKSYKAAVMKDKRSKRLVFEPDGRYHYVYRISCKTTGQHYYGCRTSEIHPSKDLGVVYFSSSFNEDFKFDATSNPQNYKFKVVKILNSPSDKIIFEAFLHQRFDVKTHKKFINRANQTPFGFDLSGTKRSEETKKRCVRAKMDAVDENGLTIYDKAIKKGIETKNNDIVDGLNTHQRTGKKARETKLKDIDENGLNMYERITEKCIATKRNDVDEHGMDMHKRVALLARETKLKDIDENGLNAYQRATLKILETKTKTLDENGLNILQISAKKSIETKRNDIDENGLDGNQRIAMEAKNTMLNDIDENGLNKYQRFIKKSVATKLADVDENGLNSFQRGGLKSRETRLNDIDENGLNAFQRHGKKISGTNHPNAKKMNIYDADGVIQYTSHGNFKRVCGENGLPWDALRISCRNNGTPIYLSAHTNKNMMSRLKKHGKDKFIGWYVLVEE